jgi:hypothetical protein
MPAVPVPDVGIWERMDRLHPHVAPRPRQSRAFPEESSDTPEILDAVHQQLDKDLSLLF